MTFIRSKTELADTIQNTIHTRNKQQYYTAKKTELCRNHTFYIQAK